MITKTQQEAINLYAGIMDEVKLRMDSIDFATSGLLKLHPVIIREFSYLQLRMICELIALGCLTAHGDVPGTKSRKLRKAWHADEIFEALEPLHPNFYPHPVQQIQRPGYIELQPIESGFLTKRELLTLTGRCGDALHRGSLKKLISGPISAQPDHSDVTAWVSKIKILLDAHRVGLMGGKAHFICLLKSPSHGDQVQVAFAEASLPPPGLELPFAPGDHAKG